MNSEPVAIEVNPPDVYVIQASTLYRIGAILICVTVFVAVRMFALFRFQDYFAIDEFFHIATTNPQFSWTYDRALYIDRMVGFFVNIFGFSNLSVKAVPLFMGIVSYVCFIHLASRLYTKTSIIVAASFIFTFHSLFVYNHMYIRMYVFLEALIMMSAVLLYYAHIFKQSDNKIVKYILSCMLIVVFLIGAVLYFTHTRDASSYLVLVLFSAITLVFCLEEKIFNLIRSMFFSNKKMSNRRNFVITLAVLIVIQVIIVLLKNGHLSAFLPASVTDMGRVASIYSILTTFYVYSSPVFVMYFLTHGIAFTFLLSFSVYRIVKDEEISPIRILLIFAILPFIGYNMFLYSSNMFRTFTPYFSVLILVCFWCLEKNALTVKYKQLLRLVLTVIAIFTIYFSYPSGPMSFINQPHIARETLMDHYGPAVRDAFKMQRYAGRRLVAVLAAEQIYSFFRMDADVVIFTYGVSVDEQVQQVHQLLGQFETSDKVFFIFDRDAYIRLIQNYALQFPERAEVIRYTGYVTTVRLN